jgi:hypothetical protein
VIANSQLHYRSASAIGTAVLYLICQDEAGEGSLSCDSDGGGFADGLVTLTPSPL